jgi:hypothetical protein
MANPITGDFHVVLQVSGKTINRLLASMHQNAFSDPDRPSFPHAIALRIGDEYPFDGVRGLVHAQIGVPSIELIHGATDRFIIEVGVRGWYRADPGTEPLPAFIHGTVRAEYRIENIDPNCAGWGNKSFDYIWVRVVRDSVRFTGTAGEDTGPLGVAMSTAAGGTAGNIAKITNQIAHLLETRFEATPHKVSSERFKRGAMRSLSTPIGGTAVALPLPVNGPPTGAITSIENLILEGADFGIGVSRDYIMSLVRSAIDSIAGFKATYPVDEAGISTVYRVAIDPPAVEWQPNGASAVVTLKIHGTATTDSILPNVTVDITQQITINFVPEQMWLSPGSRSVTVKASGLASWIVSDIAAKRINSAVENIVVDACTNAQPTLDAMIARKEELSTELRSLDGSAAAYFDQALFLPDGVILRGTIALAARKRAAITFSKTAAEDAYTALSAWLPGGRIDKFEWSWTWAGQRPKGAATHDDRFLLRRPAGGVSRWGMAVQIAQAIPGLDGAGTVCLRLRGVQVDSVTGEVVPVDTGKRCLRFGLDFATGVRDGIGRLFLRDIPELSQDVPFPQLALIEAGTARSSANTLLLYAHRSWEPETADTLRAGFEHSHRRDAGIAMLVLFREGVLAAAGPGLLREIEEIGERLGVFIAVNEDVGGNWSKAFGFESSERGYSWRLLSPHGGVTWTHQGPLDPERLATALDRCLIRSAPAAPKVMRSGLQLGSRFTSGALHLGYRDVIHRKPCPPLPLNRSLKSGSVVTFVQRGSRASEIQLRELAARYSEQREDAPLIVAVLDGADDGEAEQMKNELGFDFAVVPDFKGRVADRFGVRVWPTTVLLDSGGTVVELHLGSHEMERTTHGGSTDRHR